MNKHSHGPHGPHGKQVWDYVFGGYTHQHKPLGAYAVLVGAFHSAFGGFLYASKALDRPLPACIGPGDLLLLGVATHKLSRTISRDWVTSVLRAPFTRLKGAGKLPKELKEEARGEGMRRAIGELVTCPFCTGQWVAALLTYLLVLNPPLGRLVASIFTVISASDFLHAAWIIAGSMMEQAGSKEEESSCEHQPQPQGQQQPLRAA